MNELLFAILEHSLDSVFSLVYQADKQINKNCAIENYLKD